MSLVVASFQPIQHNNNNQSSFYHTTRRRDHFVVTAAVSSSTQRQEQRKDNIIIGGGGGGEAQQASMASSVSASSKGSGGERQTARNLPWQKIFQSRIVPICAKLAQDKETSPSGEEGTPSTTGDESTIGEQNLKECEGSILVEALLKKGRHMIKIGNEVVLVTQVRDARKPPYDLEYGQVTIAIEDSRLETSTLRNVSEGIYLVREIASCSVGPNKQPVNERLFMDRKRENFKAKGWGTGCWRVWLALEDVDAHKKKRRKLDPSQQLQQMLPPQGIKQAQLPTVDCVTQSPLLLPPTPRLDLKSTLYSRNSYQELDLGTPLGAMASLGTAGFNVDAPSNKRSRQISDIPGMESPLFLYNNLAVQRESMKQPPVTSFPPPMMSSARHALAVLQMHERLMQAQHHEEMQRQHQQHQREERQEHMTHMLMPPGLGNGNSGRHSLLLPSSTSNGTSNGFVPRSPASTSQSLWPSPFSSTASLSGTPLSSAGSLLSPLASFATLPAFPGPFGPNSPRPSFPGGSSATYSPILQHRQIT